jgi:hypothetical protein
MNFIPMIISCGDCDFYNEATDIVVKIPNAGECFLGEIEKFDGGRQSRLSLKIVGKTKKPCGYFMWKVDDGTFLSEA